MLERNSTYFPTGILLTLKTSSLVYVLRLFEKINVGLRMVACVAGVERDIGVGREGRGPYSL